MYDDLDNYDTRPLVYQSIIKGKSRGRFGAKKKEGHVGLEAMKKCFLSGGSPALSPSKSRLVEALCINLCNDICNTRTVTRNDGSKRYLSRWKQIVQEYNDIRARLFNSHLLEATNVTLFTINETTLRKWHQDKTRREDILNLMQGRDPPGNLAIAAENLPPATAPNELHGSAPKLSFDEAEDRSGLAKLRFLNVSRDPVGFVDNSSIVDDLNVELDTTHHPEIPRETSVIQPSQLPHISTDTPLSTTTLPPSKSRKRKINPKPNKAPTPSVPLPYPQPIHPLQPMFIYPSFPSPFAPMSPPISPPPMMPLHNFQYTTPPSDNLQSKKKERKVYTCKKCGLPMKSANHGQFKGQRYCGNEPGALLYEKWLKRPSKGEDSSR
ncbi:MAG: hypothetical protein AAF391_13595 [Bacteroidota bacterium]